MRFRFPVSSLLILTWAFVCILPSSFSQTEPDWDFGLDKDVRFRIDSSMYLENHFFQATLLDSLPPSILIIRNCGKMELDSLQPLFQQFETVIFKNTLFVGASAPMKNETISALFLSNVGGDLTREIIPHSLKSLVLEYFYGLNGAAYFLKSNPNLEYLFVRSGINKRIFRKIKHLKKLKTLLVHGFFSHLPKHIQKLDSLHTLRIANTKLNFDPELTQIRSLKTLQISQKTQNLEADLRAFASMDQVQTLMLNLHFKPRRIYHGKAFVVTLPFGQEMKSLETLRISISADNRETYGPSYVSPEQIELIFPEQFSLIPHLSETYNKWAVSSPSDP